MKSILVALLVLGSSLAWADGSGAGSAVSSGSGSDCQPANHVDPFDKRPVCAGGAPLAPAVGCAVDAKDLRKTCADAMNADPTFAVDIVKKADAVAQQKRDEATVAAHDTAAKEIAVNQRHVILAYAAMWIIAAFFVIFLWRRQRALVAEIEVLRGEMKRATAAEPGVKA